MGYEPISSLGNYFVGVDGEGFIGDEYGLLDSSLSEYPRLFKKRRLTSLECLDWLWGIGKYAGFCVFVLYGARYDYDNWLFGALNKEQIVVYHSGNMVRIGPYAVVHKPGYKWELRKVQDEKNDGTIVKYERIRTRTAGLGTRVDRIGVTLWDVLPFWQSKFEAAIYDTLGDEAEKFDLIKQGKSERGSFRYEDIDHISEYNQAECINLARMMVKLEDWFASVGIRLNAYNGPGAAAKALLDQYQPFRHAGRVVGQGKHRVSDYLFPGWKNDEAFKAARSAYAGGRNQIAKLGYRPGESKVYDINSAYPHAMTFLSCLTHGRWRRTTDYEPDKFGLYRIRYKTQTRNRLFPFFFRDSDGSIHYPPNIDDKWVFGSELEAGLVTDPAGVAIREGRVWDYDLCDCPNPFWWVRLLSNQRLEYKSQGAKGQSLALKLPLNSLYGSLAQARGGGGFNDAPWSQQILWAGDVTARTRAKLYLAAMLDPDSVFHLATDGLITGRSLPLDIGPGLGQWEEATLTDLSLVQYGVYFAKEKSRWRGFDLDESKLEEFVKEIHLSWVSPWRSVSVSQRVFVTSGLVATGGEPYNKWCTWLEQPRTLNLDIDNAFEKGSVESLDRLYDVRDMISYYGMSLGKSAPYEPKWGKGGGFPWEIDDEIEEAFKAGVHA